ncbi:hypothetical protein M408DRAFT_256166 [Serendipita vermifera MAFF 305830]|uniref:PARP catalytic domain-containing protein n=1 Tax=Serendipita vermifera MAFF 305830 TaxID=933852 RepID=A0A0C2WYT7_SERVB|nr:hypothetical protein M408DRAFT_256166 [Serendipita vermifera MAFF 305830]
MQFRDQWKHDTTMGVVKHVYLVVVGCGQRETYENYKLMVEAMVNSRGVEKTLWHGTTRKCSVGEPGVTELCRTQNCGVCGIVRTSFSLAYYKKNTGWGRFGRGLYTSEVSSKAASYSKSLKNSPLTAMFLATVVIGRTQTLHRNSPNRIRPKHGYNSVHGQPGGAGKLNYEEYVVYTDDAIVPSYLVMYE